MTKNKFNPWPIGIAVICVAAFAAAATVVVVMVKQRVELVRPDYYAQDLRHEKRMEQTQRAQKLQTPTTIAYDNTTSLITIDFPSTNVYGHIMLYRPSDLSLDREVIIDVDTNSRQIVETDGLADGLWRVRIEWFLDEQSFYQETAISIQ